MLRLSLVILLALTVPAQAAPVVAAVGAVGAWYASIGVVGQLAVQIGVGLALTAASYGLQALISGGSRRAEQAGNQDTASVTLPEIDGLLEVVRAYGTLVTPGGVFFRKTVADTGATGPNRYVLGLALSEGVCDGLDALIINGVVCQFDESGVPQTAPWNDGFGNTFVAVSFRPGTTTQAIDPIIAARFPSEDAEFRQRGVCTLVLDMHFGDDAEHHTELWGTSGIPTILVRLRGLRVYDRDDPLQDSGDPTTWTFTDTATVAMEDYLVAEIGGQIARDEIDHDPALESIRLDKENVVTLDGIENNGRVNGLVFASEANVDVLSSMAQQNRATISKAGGKYVIRADRPPVPVATIHQGQWLGQLSFRNERDTRSAIDGIVTQFYPASRFNQAADTSYPAAALDDPDAQRVTMRFSDTPGQAQRLGYGLVQDNQAGRQISGAFDISVLVAPGKSNRTLQVGDVVWFEANSPYDGMSGLYRVDSLELTAPSFGVSLALSEAADDAITGWSTALETPFAAEDA